MTMIKLNEITQFANHDSYSPGSVVDDLDTNRAAYLIGMGSAAAHDGIPVNLEVPKITRDGVVVTTGAEDDVLACSPGTWEGVADIVLTYQWESDNVVIDGATNASFTVLAAQAGTDVTCVVTGTNGEGADTAETAACVIAA